MTTANYYASLNGLGTTMSGLGCTNYGNYGSYGYYGGYGYGMDAEDVEQYKENIANNYEVQVFSQSYADKQGIETMTLNDQCESIQMLMSSGRIDDASEEFENLVAQIKALPQYESYTDQEIRTIARSQYQTATGVDILTDIDNNASGSFWQGIKEGIPIFGTIFAENTTKEDFQAQVTGIEKSEESSIAETIGAALTGGAVGVAGVATLNLAGKNAKKLKGLGKWGMALGAVGVAIGVVKSLVKTKES